MSFYGQLYNSPNDYGFDEYPKRINPNDSMSTMSPMTEEYNEKKTEIERMINEYNDLVAQIDLVRTSYTDNQKNSDMYREIIQLFNRYKLDFKYLSEDQTGVRYLTLLPELNRNLITIRSRLKLFDGTLSENQKILNKFIQKDNEVISFMTTLNEYDRYIVVDKYRFFINLLKAAATYLISENKKYKVPRDIFNNRGLDAEYETYRLNVVKLLACFDQFKEVYERSNLHEPISKIITMRQDIKRWREKMMSDYGEYIKVLDTDELRRNFEYVYQADPLSRFRSSNPIDLSPAQFPDLLFGPGNVFVVDRVYFHLNGDELDADRDTANNIHNQYTDFTRNAKRIEEALSYMRRVVQDVDKLNKDIQDMKVVITDNIKADCRYRSSYVDVANESEKKIKELKTMKFPDNFNNYVTFDVNLPNPLNPPRTDPWTGVANIYTYIQEVHMNHYTIKKSEEEQIKEHYKYFSEISILVNSITSQVKAKAKNHADNPLTVKKCMSMLETVSTITKTIDDTIHVVGHLQLVNINDRARDALSRLKELSEELKSSKDFKIYDLYKTSIESYKAEILNIIGDGARGEVSFLFRYAEAHIGSSNNAMSSYITYYKNIARRLNMEATSPIPESGNPELILHTYEASLREATRLLSDTYDLVENVGIYLNIVELHDANITLRTLVETRGLINNQPYSDFMNTINQTTAMLDPNRGISTKEDFLALSEQMIKEVRLKRQCIGAIQTNNVFTQDEQDNVTKMLAADTKFVTVIGIAPGVVNDTVIVPEEYTRPYMYDLYKKNKDSNLKYII